MVSQIPLHLQEIKLCCSHKLAETAPRRQEISREESKPLRTLVLRKARKFVLMPHALCTHACMHMPCTLCPPGSCVCARPMSYEYTLHITYNPIRLCPLTHALWLCVHALLSVYILHEHFHHVYAAHTPRVMCPRAPCRLYILSSFLEPRHAKCTRVCVCQVWLTWPWVVWAHQRPLSMYCS